MENRQHGKWTRPRPKSYIRICSVCKNESYFVGNGEYPNCPYCLSIMDGKIEKPKRPRKVEDVCKTRCIYKNECTREGLEKKYCLVRYLILESLDKVGK